MNRIILALAAVLLLAAAPGAFKPGQHVEVEYLPDSGKWLPATIVEVLNDGYSYKVKVAPYGDGKTIVADIHYKRVRAASQTAAKITTAPARAKTAFGKYGCSASHYDGTAVEYVPRGSFVIDAKGTYAYHGFSRPSSGTFSEDAAGNLTFKGGYFDGGRAQKVDRPNMFFVVFPTNPDSRWTCRLVR